MTKPEKGSNDDTGNEHRQENDANLISFRHHWMGS
jgi:hypothetical protein